jgi:hypothetical protein
MAQQSLIDEHSEPNDATPFLPERRTLTALREAAAGYRGCHLWRGATQSPSVRTLASLAAGAWLGLRRGNARQSRWIQA